MKKVLGLFVGIVVGLIAFSGMSSAQAQGYYYYRETVCPAFYYWDPYLGVCVPTRQHYRDRPRTTEERVLDGVLGVIEGIQENERRRRHEDWCRRSGRC